MGEIIINASFSVLSIVMPAIMHKLCIAILISLLVAVLNEGSNETEILPESVKCFGGG